MGSLHVQVDEENGRFYAFSDHFEAAPEFLKYSKYGNKNVCMFGIYGGFCGKQIKKE